MPSITRAISIKQPFVEQILLGEKTREYRTAPTNIRERVYLYASLKPRTEPALWRKMTSTADELPKGLIVGSVEIVDCKPDATGGFAYKLANSKRLRQHLKLANQPGPVFWIPQF